MFSSHNASNTQEANHSVNSQVTKILLNGLVMTNKNYFLITGSSSGLGENLVINLNEKGFKTIGIDINEGKYTDIVIDLAGISEDDIEKIKVKLENSKIDSIIHCAAVQKSPQKDITNISKTFDEVFCKYKIDICPN